jgi:hypothetical protein
MQNSMIFNKFVPGKNLYLQNKMSEFCQVAYGEAGLGRRGQVKVRLFHSYSNSVVASCLGRGITRGRFSRGNGSEGLDGKDDL